MSSSTKHKFPFMISAIILLVGLSAHIFLVFHYDFTQDDAWITFRYAQNFLDGNGLVYNIGERVEGYTNFLWTVLMILGKQIGFGFVGLSKTLGTLFGVATILLMFFLGRLLYRDIPGAIGRILPSISCLILGSVYSFAYWAVAGLETAAFAFFVLLSIYSYLRRSMLAIPAVVLSTLLRPEGGLVFAFIVCYELIARRSFTPFIKAAVSLYIIFLLPFLAFKFTYYGSILPNSFYAKTVFSLDQILYGLDYLWLFAGHYLGFGLLIIPAIMIFRKAPKSIRLCLAFAGVYTLYIVLIGGDVLKVHRFFIPLFPLLIPVMVYGIYSLLKSKYIYIIGLIALLAGQLYLPRTHVSDFHNAEVGLAFNMNSMMDNLIAADQSNFSLAVSTIGLVGYRLMGHNIIDLLGLTDSTIARHPEPPVEGLETSWRESHFNTGYVISRQPDYILFSTGFKPSAPAERDLFLHRAFLKSYRTIGFFYSGAMHSIFKRFLPVESPVKRDVDVRFVQKFNRGINLLLREARYTEALGVFAQAQDILQDTTYPYLYYYASIAFGKMGDFDTPRTLLDKITRLDTLVYEGYLGMSIYYCADRDSLNYYYHRDRLASLIPWYIPRLDSMCAASLK